MYQKVQSVKRLESYNDKEFSVQMSMGGRQHVLGKDKRVTIDIGSHIPIQAEVSSLTICQYDRDGYDAKAGDLVVYFRAVLRPMKKTKRLTVAEVEDILGYPVEIVSGKE